MAPWIFLCGCFSWGLMNFFLSIFSIQGINLKMEWYIYFVCSIRDVILLEQNNENDAGLRLKLYNKNIFFVNIYQYEKSTIYQLFYQDTCFWWIIYILHIKILSRLYIYINSNSFCEWDQNIIRCLICLLSNIVATVQYIVTAYLNSP